MIVGRQYCIVLFAFIVALTGCSSSPNKAQRSQLLASTAIEKGWKRHVIAGEQFDLLAFVPSQEKSLPLLTIYIEGDGKAWKNRFEASDDPTPVKPIALELALQHPGAVYLSRPCQSIKTPQCTPEIWTHGRFSEPVISAINMAIDNLKARYQADVLQLIGYSGGGSVAALIAARRSDVERLVTVAGNLDHSLWTTHHGVSALSTSLNPADFRESLETISQYHLVGQDDDIVPPKLTQQFIEGFSSTADITLQVVADFDHHCCWKKQWRSLLKEIDCTSNIALDANGAYLK